MGKFAKGIATVAKTVATSTSFDWSTFKGGELTFAPSRVDIGTAKTGVRGSMGGTGAPYIRLHVRNDAGKDELSLADLQAGYRFDKADIASLDVKAYQGRDGSEKWKLTARDFAVTGFPSEDAARSVTSIRVRVPS